MTATLKLLILIRYMKILSQTTLLFFACASASSAVTVSFNVSAGNLTNAAGDLMPVNGIILMVGSTVDREFTDAVDPGAYNVGDFLGADDVIFYRGDLTGSGSEAGLFSESVELDTDAFGLVANDPVSLYWFPNSNNAGGAGSINLVSGTDGGLYTSTTGDDGGEAWVVPGAGQSNLLMLTSSFGGSISADDAQASSGFVVPEPSSLLSLSFGALLLLRRRR